MDSSTSLLYSPSNNGSFYSDDQLSSGRFVYGLGFSLILLVVVVLLLLLSYLCRRMGLVPQEPSNIPIHGSSLVRHDRPSGLDDALGTFPEFPYSQAKDHGIGRGGGDESCTICLLDYKERDSLRMLPECGHAFHVRCVDHWLRLHPTCPVCRSSLVPSPPATPLAEATPFVVRLS